MPFNWNDYLDLSKILINEKLTKLPEEAAKRSAISRAYYAAFCHARNYATNKLGYTAKKSSHEHQGLREHYRKNRMPSIGTDLQSLEIWRCQCDYDDVISSSPIFAPGAIRCAEKIINTLK